MALQWKLENLPILMVMDAPRKAVAFKKIIPEAFIDRWNGMEAIWDDTKLTLDGTTYLYGYLHSVGEGVFKDYMKKLIEEGYSPIGHFM